MALSRMTVTAAASLVSRIVSSKKNHPGKIAAECAQKEERKEFAHQEELQNLEVWDVHQKRPRQHAPAKRRQQEESRLGDRDASQVALVLRQLLE